MSKRCANCGAPLDERAGFCPSCGARIQAAEQPAEALSRSARPQHYAQAPKSRVPVIIIASFLAVLVVAGAALAVILLTNKKDDSAKSSDPTAPAASDQATAANLTDATEATVPPTEAPTAAPTEAPVSHDGGWVTENGAEHYYIDGVLQTDTVVGDDENGWFYVDERGEKNEGYCNALTVGGADWNVIEGRAARVEDEWDACLHTALTYIGQWTDSSMSREEKLRTAFECIKDDSNFLEGVPDRDGEPYYKLNWPVICANELLVDGMGDCFSYGAAFAFMGKAIGYENCYACTTGGHGWAEIEGRAYDPEWDSHHQEYNHFGVAPEDDCDVAYFTSLTEGVDWMYVKV